MSLIDRLTKIASDRLGLLVVVGVAIWGASSMGWIEIPEIPEGWRLVAMAAIVVGIWGWIAADKIEAIWPDEHGVYLVAMRDDMLTGGRIWELTEDEFADLRVVGGPLFEWSEALHRCYEVVDYDRDRNVAIATHRGTPPASEVVGQPDVEDVVLMIREIRQDLAPEARKGREIQRRLRGIARRIDRQHFEAHSEILDETVSPSMGGDSISEIVDDMMPDDLHPESFDAGDDVGQQVADEIADDVGPTPDADGVEATAATDGGEIDGE